MTDVRSSIIINNLNYNFVVRDGIMAIIEETVTERINYVRTYYWSFFLMGNHNAGIVIFLMDN